MALSVKRIVNVSMTLSPAAAQERGFGTLLVLTDNEAITVDEGYRSYTGSDEVIEDFGSSSKVGLAAQAYFGQSPQPDSMIVARWDNKTIQSDDSTEPVTDAVSRMLNDYSRAWYGLVLATDTEVSTDELISIAQLVESATDSHIFGITTQDATLGSTAYTTGSDDWASLLMRGEYARTFVCYAEEGESSAYALQPFFAASIMGRMFTVDFDGSKTTLTMKFKQAPSLQPSDFKTTLATNLEARNINIYATYDNDTYIIEPGVMCSGMHMDERHGLDWFQDAVQTAVYNVLYQSKTKVPQTDDGVGRLVAAIAGVCQQAVTNGLVAPGTWNSDGFGNLEDGDYLENGFYIYAASVNDQTQADRESRASPAIQVAIKLAGAIESVDITVNVNR